MFRLADDRGESFERSIQLALTTVLASPRFLFLVEPEDTHQDRQLTEFELASRLSYFLWSSMPDEALFREARAGTLRANLRRQVVRMLGDAKSDAFVENFTGQWLQLRRLASVARDKELFGDFDERLRDAMREETERFFAHILRNNRSVLDLLDSAYTFVNEPLAKHYGIEGVAGDAFQQVALADRRRGGVLTQASVLTVTSNPNRTSPVKRGQWICSSSGNPATAAAARCRQARRKPASLGCRLTARAHGSAPRKVGMRHVPPANGSPGLRARKLRCSGALAIQRWRVPDRSFGRAARRPEICGHHRAEKTTESRPPRKKFARCLIENMLTYGLGRGLEAYDYCTVEDIGRQLAADEYRIQTIVFGIVESRAFQYRGIKQ